MAKKPLDIDDLRKQSNNKPNLLYRRLGPVLSRNNLDLRSFKNNYSSVHSLFKLIRMMVGLPAETTVCHQPPIGYEFHPDSKKIILPIDDEFKLLVQAKKYLRKDKYSLTKVAQWFTLQSGRKLTYTGLAYIMANRLPDDVCAQPIEERRKKFKELIDYYHAMDEELYGEYLLNLNKYEQE